MVWQTRLIDKEPFVSPSPRGPGTHTWPNGVPRTHEKTRKEHAGGNVSKAKDIHTHISTRTNAKTQDSARRKEMGMGTPGVPKDPDQIRRERS